MTEKTLTSIRELIVGKTVLRGISTAGYLVKGTLRSILPGMCFQVDQGPRTQISYLWRHFTVVEEEPSPPHITEVVVDRMTVSFPSVDGLPPPPSFPPIPQLRRTDSAADYGVEGYPDCPFWASLGIPTFFVVPNCQYKESCRPEDPIVLRHLLLAVKPKAQEFGGPYLKAWARQMAEVDCLFPLTSQ